MKPKKRVIILGGGAVGFTVLSFFKTHYTHKVDLRIIDKRQSHGYYPFPVWPIILHKNHNLKHIITEEVYVVNTVDGGVPTQESLSKYGERIGMTADYKMNQWARHEYTAYIPIEIDTEIIKSMESTKKFMFLTSVYMIDVANRVVYFNLNNHDRTFPTSLEYDILINTTPGDVFNDQLRNVPNNVLAESSDMFDSKILHGQLLEIPKWIMHKNDDSRWTMLVDCFTDREYVSRCVYFGTRNNEFDHKFIERTKPEKDDPLWKTGYHFLIKKIITNNAWQDSINSLEDYGIYNLGRYARWDSDERVGTAINRLMKIQV